MPVRTTASLHITLYGAVAAPGAPAGAKGGRKKKREAKKKCAEGTLTRERRTEKGPDRREERTMASKETTAAGFVNVSREITGELEHEFFEEVCF